MIVIIQYTIMFMFFFIEINLKPTNKTIIEHLNDLIQ